jgi:hypothetical protein
MIVVWLFTALFVKHFICDFIMQGPFQYKNKGTYMHPGGWLHAVIQGAGSLVVFFLVIGMNEFIAALILIEIVVHYHIDWAKMNLNKYWGLTPTTSEQFWWLLGFDQLLHYLTYTGMVGALIWAYVD